MGSAVSWPQVSDDKERCRATAELVCMSVQDVKDRQALWHGRMSREQRESVLRDILHEP